MFKWNIKNQILSTGVVSLLVLVGVVIYFYNFSKTEFEASSRDLIGVTVNQYAAQIDSEIADWAGNFTEWAGEDVFGLAIEFQTTTELQKEMQKWLASDTSFALLALVDQSGRVLEAAGSPALGSAQSLSGNRLPEFAEITGGSNIQAHFVQSETLDRLGFKNHGTYLFYRPAFSSSGSPVGGFVGICDWRVIENRVNELSRDLVSRGYTDGFVIIGDVSRNAIATQVALGANTFDSQDRGQLLTWGSTVTDGTVEITEIGDVACFATPHEIAPPYLGSKSDREHELMLMAAVPEDVVFAALKTQLMWIILIGVFGTLLVLGISYYNASRISRRINEVSEVATSMAMGDTSSKVSFTASDELGALARAFDSLGIYFADMTEAADAIAGGNLTVKVTPRSTADRLGGAFRKMRDNLSNIMAELDQSAQELVSAASEISSSSEQMSHGAQGQSDQVQRVLVSIEEMTATIQESSKNAMSASELSKNASDTATGGGEIVNQTITGMQTISEVVRQSAQAIADLAKSADQIGEITGVIDDIADQTNLLALNAAIEAARAGEQGRGFAVVADEVRKLAERTGKATSEISSMISGIQSQTEDAVVSMESGIQQVDKGRELSDKAGASLSEIVEFSGRVMEMIQQIAGAAEQQTGAAEEVNRSIEQIASVSAETAKGAEQSASAAEQLNRQAENLKTMVGRFTISRE